MEIQENTRKKEKTGNYSWVIEPGSVNIKSYTFSPCWYVLLNRKLLQNVKLITKTHAKKKEKKKNGLDFSFV